MQRLENEVWARDRCAGCGMCVAACSKQILEWGESEHPLRRKITKNIGLSKFDLDTCSFCPQLCEAVCPRLEPAARLVPLAMHSARASGTLGGGGPNEVVRNLLVAARASGMIDGALMMDVGRDGTTRARVVASAGEIAETLGSQQVWAPLLDGLNRAVYDLGLENLAIVSTPCTCQAVRRLMDAPVERLAPYRKAIRLSIALFCPGVFSPVAIRGLVADGFGVKPEQVQSLTALPRERQWRLQLWDGSVRRVDLDDAARFMRAGCARCDDYLGESADIAVGADGAPAGCSTLIVRTPIGEAFVDNAVAMRLLEVTDQVDRAALERVQADKGRRERAQALDELQALMLDALRDPAQRLEVRRRLDALYGGSRRPIKKEEDRYVGCGDCSGC